MNVNKVTLFFFLFFGYFTYATTRYTLVILKEVAKRSNERRSSCLVSFETPVADDVHSPTRHHTKFGF